MRESWLSDFRLGLCHEASKLTLSMIVYRDINKVDTTMDDIRDQMDIANEISDAISRPVGMGEELDEDELLNELEELEQEELDAKMLDTPAPAVITPDVPVHKPCKLSRKREEEERRYEWMWHHHH